MSSNRPRIAAAPISWGQCEVPGWGYQLPAERVLADMGRLGIHATEAGPEGFLPADPGQLRTVLDRHDMTLVSGFTPLVLHQSEAAWRQEIQAAADRLRKCGAFVVVIAAATGQGNYEMRPATTESDWRRLVAALDTAREIAGMYGMELALHPHAGTMIEKPEEIERVLGATSVPLCLDTGHVMLGGGDPVQLARQAPDRVSHVHLKDVDAYLAERVASGSLTMSEAVRANVFRPLGDGDIDLDAILETLRRVEYTGWYVMEQDVMLEDEPPPGSGPCVDVARSLEYLQRRLLGVPA